MSLELGRRLIDGAWKTIVGDDAGASSGVASSDVQVYGPFPIAWDTPDITIDNVLIGALAEGMIVVRMMVFITEVWDAAGHLFLLLSPSPDNNYWTDSGRLDGQIVGPAQANQAAFAWGSGMFVPAGGGLYASIGGGDTPATGAADVYVFGATP